MKNCLKFVISFAFLAVLVAEAVVVEEDVLVEAEEEEEAVEEDDQDGNFPKKNYIHSLTPIKDKASISFQHCIRYATIKTVFSYSISIS